MKSKPNSDETVSEASEKSRVKIVTFVNKNVI